MLTVASEEMPNQVPACSAARATACSPCQWNSRCSAVGESISGMAIRLPITVVAMSTVSTPASTLGTRSQLSKASVLRRQVTSSSAPPSI